MMERIEACRSCGHGTLETVLELGEVPLANALLDQPEDEELRFRLTLAFCPRCSLVQILETVDPEVLFGHYVYFSSFSDTMLEHAREEATMLIERRGLTPDSLVVEVASNDGYLLKNFIEQGIPVQGIEPAANIAEVARENGVPTLCEFFGRELGEALAGEGHQADVLLGNNVLAHVADLNGFAAGVAALLAHNGCAVFEMPYVRDMIEHVRVRHDLPRAPLLLLAARTARSVRAARPARHRRAAHPDPRRLAAGVRRTGDRGCPAVRGRHLHACRRAGARHDRGGLLP